MENTEQKNTIMVRGEACEVTGEIDMERVPGFMRNDFVRVVLFRTSAGESGAYFIANDSGRHSSFVSWVKPDARSAYFRAE